MNKGTYLVATGCMGLLMGGAAWAVPPSQEKSSFDVSQPEVQTFIARIADQHKFDRGALENVIRKAGAGA